MRLAALITLLAGCGADDTGFVDVSPDAPTITDGHAWCATSGESSNVTSWYVELTGDDPQGVDTLERMGGLLAVYTAESHNEVFREDLLVCSAEGACVGSFTEEASGVLCANPQNYTLEATLYDQDQNASRPYTLPID
ncbi:MAG: hypothetical protein JXX28_10130 [Deltaproteobacteria bacterium]|nr:hypothetical protein [Deltaproteobacteria bacterium]